MRGGLLGRQNDCRRAAPSAATITCEKLKKAMAIRRKAKLGEMVLVIPGMRTFSVEAKRVKQTNAANWPGLLRTTISPQAARSQPLNLLPARCTTLRHLTLLFLPSSIHPPSTDSN